MSQWCTEYIFEQFLILKGVWFEVVLNIENESTKIILNSLVLYANFLYPFKRQPHKIDTLKLPTNCLSVFDHFVGLSLRELSHFLTQSNLYHSQCFHPQNIHEVGIKLEFVLQVYLCYLRWFLKALVKTIEVQNSLR